MHRKNSNSTILNFIMSCSLLMLPTVYEANAQEDTSAAQLVSTHAEALVTVKYVLSINMGQRMGGQEQEQEKELTCSMISADGLVVCAYSTLTGSIGLLNRLSGNTLSATTKDFKILIGSSADGFDAEIVARDTELDLVWIRMTDPGDQSFAHLDFANSAEAGIGDPIVIIRRAGSTFGRTPVAIQTRIGGISSKPRKLYFPMMPSMTSLGLPVFTADGRIIGLSVTQFPEVTGDFNAGMSMMGADMTNLQESILGLVLPAQDIAKATERALEEGR